MRTALFAIVAGALVTTSCGTTATDVMFPSRDFDGAAMACDVDALAMEKQATSRAVNSTLRDVGTARRTYEETATEVSILGSKLREYDAELEASYRFVVQSCRAHMRCLERHNYSDRQCLSTGNRWTSSEGNFNQLMRDIRQIDADLQVELARLQSRGRRGGDQDGRGSDERRSEKKECCDTISNVFTDCCG